MPDDQNPTFTDAEEAEMRRLEQIWQQHFEVMLLAGVDPNLASRTMLVVGSLQRSVIVGDIRTARECSYASEFYLLKHEAARNAATEASEASTRH